MTEVQLPSTAVQLPTYQFQVQPTVTSNYTVVYLRDGTGNENVGTGNALVTVNPVPDVRITNLQTIYDVNDFAGSVGIHTCWRYVFRSGDY